MDNSKLSRVLSVLRKEEWLSLDAHVKREFSASEEHILSLFLYLRKHFTQSTSLNIEKEYVYKKIYHNQPYNDGKMRKTMHLLLQTVENWMVEQSSESVFEREIRLFRFYQQHFAAREMQEMLKVLGEKLAGATIQNSEYWQAKLQFEIFLSYTKVNQYTFNDDMNLTNVLHVQSVHFVISHIKWIFFSLANHYSKDFQNPSPFFRPILKIIEENPEYLTVALIETFYLAIQLIINSSTSEYAFYKLRESVLQSSPILSKEEWASIAIVLRNYAFKMKKEKISYAYITFDLYLEHLPLGYVFNNNRMSPHAFLLLIKSGYEVGEGHRVKQFIQNYQHTLPEAHKENLIHLAHLHVLFYEGEFVEALKGASKMDKFQSKFFEMDIRVLKIKCLCKMEEWDLTIQHLQALRVFNHRFSYNKEEKREEWRLFINYLLHYCSLMSGQNGEGLELLREEIAQDKTASELAFLRSL